MTGRMLGFSLCYCLIFTTARILGFSSNDSGGRITQVNCELLDYAVSCYWPIGQRLSVELEVEVLQFESSLLPLVSAN